MFFLIVFIEFKAYFIFMSIFLSKGDGRCFGTFKLQGNDLIQSFKYAFDIGYRIFDTAQWYDNEEDLGKAIKKMGISRSEIFITTKVHPNQYSKNLFMSSIPSVGPTIFEAILSLFSSTKPSSSLSILS